LFDEPKVIMYLIHYAQSVRNIIYHLG
jgi:hypothetical protein